MFDPTNFDPSKMDPGTLLRLSTLMQRLGPEKLSQLQMMMHNMRAGCDVRAEVEAFEKDLPPGFREEMMTVLLGSPAPAQSSAQSPMDEREARLTILRAVASGKLSPEDAEPLLRG